MRVDTYQILTHTSSSLGQMEVRSHSTWQLPLPEQFVGCISQNLHSLFMCIIEASGKKKEDVKDVRHGAVNAKQVHFTVCKDMKQACSNFLLWNYWIVEAAWWHFMSKTQWWLLRLVYVVFISLKSLKSLKFVISSRNSTYPEENPTNFILEGWMHFSPVRS